MKLKTYFLSKSLGYISIPANLELSDKVTIDHLGQSVVLELDDGTDLFLVLKAFLGETKEESEIKTRNWFTSRKLDINNLENWRFRDMSNFARMFKTYTVRDHSAFLNGYSLEDEGLYE